VNVLLLEGKFKSALKSRKKKICFVVNVPVKIDFDKCKIIKNENISFYFRTHRNKYNLMSVALMCIFLTLSTKLQMVPIVAQSDPYI